MIPKIDLMIVGAGKSGTTTLLAYLRSHPDIAASRDEIGYFVNDNLYEQGYESQFKHHIDYDTIQHKCVVSKHAKMWMGDEWIERLFQHNPDVITAAVMRNPVDRAYSSYWYGRLRGRETAPTFEAALKRTSVNGSGIVCSNKQLSRYYKVGHYLDHVEHLWDFFPREQTRFYMFETLCTNPIGLCNDLFKSIELPLLKSLSVQHRNQGGVARSRLLAQFFAQVGWITPIARRLLGGRSVEWIKNAYFKFNRDVEKVPPMNPDTRDYLIEYFRPHNRALGEALGWDLSNWGI